ncbi:VOC family protein [Aquabacterium sp.]|uniref:VOC family protein n=1 Tax=Aquabacterium sp. TaxID=1872578 RepID=UPI003783AA88
MTQDPNFTLLYVADPAASAAFYQRLLGKPPVEASPTFAMFALGSGTMLGLWRRDTVQPAATGAPGAGELAFALQGGRAAVDAAQAAWQAQGIALLQPATAMDFGYTFTAQDPDGHRLRVFAPEGA